VQNQLWTTGFPPGLRITSQKQRRIVGLKMYKHMIIKYRINTRPSNDYLFFLFFRLLSLSGSWEVERFGDAEDKDGPEVEISVCLNMLWMLWSLSSTAFIRSCTLISRIPSNSWVVLDKPEAKLEYQLKMPCTTPTSTSHISIHCSISSTSSALDSRNTLLPIESKQWMLHSNVTQV